MSNEPLPCPECDSPSLGRRDFMLAMGGTAVTLVGLEALPATPRLLRADEPIPAVRAPRPAEGLIRELYQGLTAEQRTQVVKPLNHGAANNQVATRMRVYNAPLGRRIGDVYTQPQQELVQRILRAISSDEDGYRQMTRGGTFDGSRSLQGCGADIFGDPSGNEQFVWVFSGHHLTVRCDGNTERGTVFGGPMYYGHSPDGYSARNVFNYQTRSVVSVFDELDEAQRRRAVITGSPGEGAESVRLRREGYPGLPISELSVDQRRLVATVMRTVLSPYRREDADEVMEIIGRNGGMERIHLAFYRDQGATDNNRWHFWRLEGPGFVWNYRVLPHVHTFVNIAVQA